MKPVFKKRYFEFYKIVKSHKGFPNPELSSEILMLEKGFEIEATYNFEFELGQKELICVHDESSDITPYRIFQAEYNKKDYSNAHYNMNIIFRQVRN